MDGEVIKSFLVGLGFGVDDASLAKFNKAIATATLRVSALYGSIQATTGAVAFGISKISESFEDLGYEYKIIAPAINKALILRQEMLKAYRATGINLVQVVQNALKLNISITKTKYAFEALYKSVASRFFVLLTKQSDLFRKRLYDNLPAIQNALERFVKFIFGAFDAAAIFGKRLFSVLERFYDLFVQLDHATNGWSTAILAAVAAWKFLNLGFLATPLGLLISGFTALLLLWDDFKTFKEGGQSLINWGSEMTRTIVGMTTVIVALSAAIVAAATVYNLWTNATKILTIAQAALDVALSLNPIGLTIAAVTALIGLITVLDAKWKLFGGSVTGLFESIGGKVLNFLGGSNVPANVANTPNGVPAAAPVATGVQNNRNSTTQSVNQQTNINIQGSADAHSTGKTVANEQNKVNMDLVRNLKGATTPGAGNF